MISLLGIYLKKPGTLMFTAALFTISKIWKQPMCPPVDEWTKQLWDTYKMEYYSAIKDNFTLCDSVDGCGEHYAE